MKKWSREKYFLMAIALGCTQFMECGMIAARASESEYEGTTQFSTSDIYTELDTSAVELVIEEVYISEGSYLEAEGKVLKLTDESYQEALDYYTAAILYANNDLTNAQLEYD